MTSPAVERQTFDALLLAIAGAFDVEGRAGGDTAAARLRGAINRPVSLEKAHSHPAALLREVGTLETSVGWMKLVPECASCLNWEHWRGKGLADDVSSSLYTTELLGPDGHVRDKEVRVGLLVSEAWTDYPLSSHSGEETYYVIAGHAEWAIESTPYTMVSPGSFVHHPAWVPHGRRTLAEPFLGAWRWSGDLDLASFEVAPS
ncbi:dimethylsulfonioproprionate lyase family protein [Roseibium sp.]|uniref:dimethylsulfonioproprionate lyase family protein n=1 Tax=Roseibium sp. TaxID=1936156 RepID=UPI003BAADB63